MSTPISKDTVWLFLTRSTCSTRTTKALKKSLKTKALTKKSSFMCNSWGLFENQSQRPDLPRRPKEDLAYRCARAPTTNHVGSRLSGHKRSTHRDWWLSRSVLQSDKKCKARASMTRVSLSHEGFHFKLCSHRPWFPALGKAQSCKGHHSMHRQPGMLVLGGGADF